MSDRIGEIAQCPFVESHTVELARLDFHISKCKRKNNQQGLMPCMYDTKHWELPENINEHMKTCPSRSRFDVLRYGSNEENRITPAAPSEPASTSTPMWDEEEPVGSYNPTQHLQQNPILHIPRGKTRREREIHRQQETLRFMNNM